MATRTLRYSTVRPATIEADATTSGAVDISSFRSGCITIPAAFSGASVTYETSSQSAGPFAAAADEDGAAIAAMSVTPGSTYPIPADVLRCGAFRIASSLPEAAEREITVFLKG